MLKSIFVTPQTHPELYSNELNLNLDFSGDVIFIDPELKILYRLPILDKNHIVLSHEVPEIEYLFNGIEVE